MYNLHSAVLERLQKVVGGIVYIPYTDFPIES